MNNKQLYLAWLRTYAPTVYMQAVKTATGRNRNLGGLGDDLLDSALSPNLKHSFLGDDSLDEITVTAQAMPDPVYTNFFNIGDTPTFDQSSVTAPSFNIPVDSGTATGLPAQTSGPSSSSVWTNVLQAVTTIGAGVINANNQSKLISLNTQRAQQGLPPVNAQGVVVSPYGTASTSPSLLAFERSISGASGSMLLPILAVLGLGAFLVFRKKSAA